MKLKDKKKRKRSSKIFSTMGGTGPIYISAKGGEMEVKKSVLAEEAKCRAEKIKRKKSC